MSDTVEAMKAEAAILPIGKGTWRENDTRLIWCGRNEDGSFTFHNTTHPARRGPKISEQQAAVILTEEGPWIAPRGLSI